VYRRGADGAISTVVPKRRGVGGIALHAGGGLVISGRDVCHVHDGTTRILLRRPDIPGFNDLFTDAAGRVYTGSIRSDPFAAAARIPGECYRIDAEGSATELYRDVGLSNGLGFSPDGRRLYHSETSQRVILVHDMVDEGRTANRRVLATLPTGMPDGLAVDEAGCVWVAAFEGGCVFRYTPDGRIDRWVEVPAQRVTSLCFGGADRRDLYVVTADNTETPPRQGTIFHTRSDVAGLPAPLARV
jgi:gluconolactonase